MAFRASGLADLLRRLDDHGVEYRRSYIEELDLTQLFLQDPSGTGLEVNFKGEVPA